MQKQISFFLFLTIATFALTIIACKKDADTSADQASANKAAEAMRSQLLITSSFNIAQRGATQADGLLSSQVEDRTDTCGTLSVTPLDPAVFPKVVTVDFGTGCTDGDGKFKSGKFILTIGKIWESNTEMSIQYDNYVEDGVKLAGKFTFGNLSTVNAGIFTIVAQNVTVTNATNASISYDAAETFTQVSGHPTWWDWSDDVYQITGNINAILSTGEFANWTIQTPLTKANNCYWVSQGTGILDINGLLIGIDYGSGSCDNQATATINGQVFPIAL